MFYVLYMSAFRQLSLESVERRHVVTGSPGTELTRIAGAGQPPPPPFYSAGGGWYKWGNLPASFTAPRYSALLGTHFLITVLKLSWLHWANANMFWQYFLAKGVKYFPDSVVGCVKRGESGEWWPPLAVRLLLNLVCTGRTAPGPSPRSPLAAGLTWPPPGRSLASAAPRRAGGRAGAGRAGCSAQVQNSWHGPDSLSHSRHTSAPRHTTASNSVIFSRSSRPPPPARAPGPPWPRWVTSSDLSPASVTTDSDVWPLYRAGAGDSVPLHCHSWDSSRPAAPHSPVSGLWGMSPESRLWQLYQRSPAPACQPCKNGNWLSFTTFLLCKN